MNLITENDKRILAFFKALEETLNRIERLTADHKPVLDGEHLLTDREVSQKLRISQRTLQNYRSQGRISYIQFGGKILYRESELEKILKTGHINAFEF